MSRLKPCAVAGCLRTARTRNLCLAHYERLKKTGDLKADQPILALNARRWGSLAQLLKGLRTWGG